MISENYQRIFQVQKDFKIHAFDIDVMGIVSNIVYIRWFEELRTLLLDEHWSLQSMIKNKVAPVLAKTEIEYKCPLTIYDSPTGYAWLSELGRAKWKM